MKKSLKTIAKAGVIAALYVILTYLSHLFGLASGEIQIRISECLCILPCFTASAVPGVTFGCFLSNLLMGAPLPDLLFGTLATFLGVCLTLVLRKNRWIAPIPTIVCNALILPPVLAIAYGIQTALPLLALLIAAGEFVSCWMLGQVLYGQIQKNQAMKSLLKN